MTASIDYGLTQAFLRTLYMLEEPAGILRHKRRPMRMFKTPRACNVWNTRWYGKIVNHGASRYKCTSICLPDGRKLRVQVHNIIECMRTGKWPTDEIDHANGNTLDNSLDNHRLVPRYRQMENRCRNSNNTSGVAGVCWNRCKQEWLSRLMINGDYLTLYHGDSFDDAVMARRAGELRYFGKYRRK